MRRDFGAQSWTLELVKEKVGRVIAVRDAHRSMALHATVEKSEPAAVGRSATERAIAGSATHSHEMRWRVRSTLLLIVSVGVVFWGAVFWLIFG